MMRYAALLLTILAVSSSQEARRHRDKIKYEDPFEALDHQLSHSLAFHYLWPWSQLMSAAAGLDITDNLEEPNIVSNTKSFQVFMPVRRFKPDELKVKVKNNYIIVEGNHKNDKLGNTFMANHFVQRFALPSGSKPEEVTAVLNENSVLAISAPRHPLPPPPPEREVPIEVRLPTTTTAKPEVVTEQEATTEKQTETPKTEKPEATTELKDKPETTEAPLEVHLLDSTAHVGKIRKKELKNTTKHVKDNEVTKGVDGNNLDYALIEPEE